MEGCVVLGDGEVLWVVVLGSASGEEKGVVEVVEEVCAGAHFWAHEKAHNRQKSCAQRKKVNVFK